ncbi:altered inheritance of mitochondria protein 21 [Podospora fimiseda]|uniref:Altered inheritance of mitochondria protein 21 n=1 Tax=Podospora fimiseda TaxID=252190 RepID=A0AAN7BU70_9PEZI|nr:altered inheritance of mitochondria protein 21 [Podospora fimiseda]
MSTTTAPPQQPPVPPRPSRSPGQDKTSTAAPMVPPRPAKTRIQRSISPNPDRFAPSPLNESAFAKHQKTLHPGHHADHIPRSTSVDLPALGEEGAEYASFTQELSSSNESSTNPEHTRTVGEDIKLHAPKPSLPAASAKQRVMAVTRTDSDRAASFGIGRPSSNDDSTTAALPSGRSLKKKASTTSQLSVKSDLDDEQGIPEIGLQVPMYKNAGDVQAPSPAPGATEGKNHKRRTSARGNLPPGSYGLHGHGVVSQDKLDQAYYEKHPERRKKEHYTHHHDRVKDFSMSSEDLNKIVRDTLANGAGLAVKNYPGTPSDQVAWQALEESTSRVASPGPSEPAKAAASPPSDSGKEARRPSSISDVIHVDEPNRRRSVMFSEVETPKVDEEEDESPYSAPILADDEVAKDPSPYVHEPAVELSLGESTSRPTSRPSSRPSSRPASIYKEASFELRPTPLEDVEEYEPLFNDDDKPQAKSPVKEENPSKKNGATKKQRFPSADIWEDAPSSVYYTAEVSTPDIAEENNDRKKSLSDVPQREGETPAQAFARRQEELAEKETRERGPDGFIPGRGAQQKPPSWAQHQLLKSESGAKAAPSRPGMGNRFPSRDVWEDTPDSLKLETTVSTPQQDEEDQAEKSPVAVKTSPVVPAKPEIPSRPKPRTLGDDNKPAIPERPKPAIPARPVKAGPPSGGQEPAEAAAPPKQKPAVPARPAMSGKIAALQAGFMNDLNRRLQLGPQAVLAKKEEEKKEEAEEKEEEKPAPLSDARKGRARGPQRRAPTAAAKTEEKKVEEKPAFNFSFSTVSSWDIDPEEGLVSVGSKPVVVEGEPVVKPEAEEEEKQEEEKKEPDTLPGAFPGTDPLTPLQQKSEAEAEVKPEAEAEPEAPKEEKEKSEEPAEPEVKEEKKEEKKPEPEPEKVETKSLVTNTTGETIVAEEVKKEDAEPVKVEEKGGQAA